ncbi:MAG: AI-2E family transporter, partial [Tyzzerella sp.]|nr:AI-2E family transporter [Tyzzerella sp.]
MTEKQQEEIKKNQFWQKQDAPKNEYYTNRPEFEDKGPSRLRQYFANGMSLFIVLVSVIILYFVLLRIDDISNIVNMVLDILNPFIYGLAIAYLLNPVMKFIERYLLIFVGKVVPDYKKKEKLCRFVAVIASIIFLIAIVVALVNMMLPELIRSIRKMTLALPYQIDRTMENLSVLTMSDSTLGVAVTQILTESMEYLENWLRTDMMDQINAILSNVTEGVISVFQGLFDLIIGLFISAYSLFSKEVFTKQCKKIIYAVCKPSNANLILHITGKSNEYFGGFIIGKIIDSAIIGVLCFIGLSILDMPYTLLVSVIVGVTNVIPFFGPYIGAIPSALLILLTDPKMGLYFIIFILALQQLDGNVIGPKILGDSTGLSIFWVMFAILVG